MPNPEPEPGILTCCIHPGCFAEAYDLDLVLCWHHHARYENAALIEDIDWMAQNGESATMIIRRLGDRIPSIDALEIRLRRAGRPDLARIFHRAEVTAA